MGAADEKVYAKYPKLSNAVNEVDGRIGLGFMPLIVIGEGFSSVLDLSISDEVVLYRKGIWGGRMERTEKRRLQTEFEVGSKVSFSTSPCIPVYFVYDWVGSSVPSDHSRSVGHKILKVRQDRNKGSH